MQFIIIIFNRLLIGGLTSYFANTIKLYKNVWNNNVDITTSFNVDVELQMEKTLHQPHTAFYWFNQDVLNNKKFECKVK